MLYELEVEATTVDNPVNLRLKNREGQHCGSHQVSLPEHSRFFWEGLFDTRQCVQRYAGSLHLDGQPEPATPGQLVDHLGTFLGREVLGPEILGALTQDHGRRTLLVRLPAPGDNPLAAAFARVPWEIARGGPDQPPLLEQAVVVRALTGQMPLPDATLNDAAERLREGKPLRVLIVSAEAPGSSPLAMRLERRRLLDLFHGEILPNRRVEVDVLCHGVTKRDIRERITDVRGYHIMHWSGHGHVNLLELCGEDGQPELISGQGLVDLIRDAGGFIPHLVFLSSCLSGTVIHDWASFNQALRENRPDTVKPESPEPKGEPTEESADDGPLNPLFERATGYTGTALALLQQGVPQVVAMRYSVGDNYARELARQFYKHLLGDAEGGSIDDALALARDDLRRDGQHAGQYATVDHATPLVFGHDVKLPPPAEGQSQQVGRRHPQPQPLLSGGSHELDEPHDFVGRGKELTRLRRQWLDKAGPAVALIQGMAGLGKTTLAAEAIQLWHHPRFRWVLAFQAKPMPLSADEFYRKVDEKLTLDSTVYGDACRANPNRHVYLKPGEPLSGNARYERMRQNLLSALQDEAILLVVDNFEPNLQKKKAAGASGYDSAEPEWDALLRFLVAGLPATRSRLLITSRHRPAVLTDEAGVLWIPLGPLSGAEAALYIPTHSKLAQLYYEGGPDGAALVRRLLDISRGHPFIMDRLAALADDPTALGEALDRLDSEGTGALPELFTAGLSDEQAQQQRKYLEDLAVQSVDLLIERLTPDARRLLWIVTLANEAVGEQLIEGVWSGKSIEEEQFEQFRAMVEMVEQMPEQARPEELREMLDQMPAELREKLRQPAAAGPETPPVGPLLAELHEAGLLSRQEEDDHVTYGFHELARERAARWMASHEDERAGQTEQDVWIAYGERYEAMFKALTMAGQPGARQMAAEAGRRALVYMIRAGAFERLGSFASGLVTGTNDPTLLRGVIAELKAVVDQVPAGKSRWSVRTYLADAVVSSGRPDESLSLYRQSATEAEEAGHWSDVAWVCANWAGALRAVGQLDEARAMQLRSAKAVQKANRPRVDIVGCELETLRIDVRQGKAKEALPEIERQLDEVRGWWEQHRTGQTVTEAPDPIFLSRVLVACLDVALRATLELEQWQACLDLLEEQEQTKRELGESEHKLALTRFNRYGPLIRLDRLDEAQRVLEDCLDVFRGVDDLARQAKVLGALADLWNERGDTQQAVGLERRGLDIFNRLADPANRAISHGNMANHLNKAHQPDESTRHRLAAIIYNVVSGHRESLSTDIHNLRCDIHRAAASGEHYELPRLATLLELPEFDALKRFLAQWQVEIAELQATIDQIVEQIRRAVESEPG